MQSYSYAAKGPMKEHFLKVLFAFTQFGSQPQVAAVHLSAYMSRVTDMILTVSGFNAKNILFLTHKTSIS